MASMALAQWRTTASARLDELEGIHRDARGSGPGRRWGTEQLNRSMFVILLAQFQTFCRDLHNEAVDVHIRVAHPAQAAMLHSVLTSGRKLDHGNPRLSALGSDFGRLGLTLAPALRATQPAMRDALDRLETLVDFRNGLAHGNESEVAAASASGRVRATLGSYRAHRRSLGALATTMDEVVADELAAQLGVTKPW